MDPKKPQPPSANGRYVLSAAELSAFLESLIARFDTYAPVAKGKQVVFGEVQHADEVKLDYVDTILPPKKFFYAPFETLFHFHRELGITHQQVASSRQRVLFGLHPCDVAALGLLDRVLASDEYHDDEYRHKREQTLVVALNCTQPGRYCFCTSFGTGPVATSGHDIAITPLRDRYLVEAGSEDGLALLSAGGFTQAGSADLWEKAGVAKAAHDAIRHRMPTDRMPRMLNQNFDHPVWQRVKDECLSCGACTVACPTCYCFNVWDQVNLDLTTGKRRMVWDSCQLLDFGEVALGHNFRRDRAARVKQRVYHKLSYFNEQYGAFGCVGCGRCASTCPKRIDLVNIVNEIGG